MNINGIMKKFKLENSIPQQKKNEKEVTNKQRNTLLEPNNFIPQWEAGGVEQKEVSQTLKVLRQKYDKIHKTVEAKQKELDEFAEQWRYDAHHKRVFGDAQADANTLISEK